jgi:multicomponent Na+:H+ antiporter subunit A
VFVGFAGSMLGLVVSDDLLLLYVFWELTTIFSYLLIGHDAASRPSRRAAAQALIVTTAGGLAMLVGIVMLGQHAGSYLWSEVSGDLPGGGYLAVAVTLILVGAVTKSALVPFSFWLPAAMAAPTPVSAYLHAAAMVKAGVFLVGLLAPALADAGPWRPVTVVGGLVTMLLGGWTALRQTDLKLLLAHGTVSQLGLLTAVLGLAYRDAALAGVAMLLVILAFPLPPVTFAGRLRPVGLLRFGGRFLADLVVASVQLAGAAFRFGYVPRGAVVRVRLAVRSDLHLTLCAEAVSLIPGSLIVDTDRDAGVLYVHVFDVVDRGGIERFRRGVYALEARIIRAVGSAAELDQLAHAASDRAGTDHRTGDHQTGDREDREVRG